MSYLPRIDAATTAEWPDLVDELDRWGQAGRVATLWWRDDDAVTATPQLGELLRLAEGVPLALAVIPALARPELAAALQGRPRVAVLQHGWRHANRAEHGKKSEYPEGRSAAVVAAEIGAGRARLKALFGGRAPGRAGAAVEPLRRRISAAAVAATGSPGFRRWQRRQARPCRRGLVAIDVHVDLVAWHGDRGFIGERAALGGLVAICGRAGSARSTPAPIGILTHHLVMDGATAAFLDRLIRADRATMPRPAGRQPPSCLQ